LSNVTDRREENQNNLKACFEEEFSVMKSTINARIQGLGSALFELNKNIKVEMEHNRGEINDDTRNMIEELGIHTNGKFERLRLNMDNINKAQALKMNTIMGQNELTKDLVKNMKRTVEDHFNKLNRVIGSNSASISMINTTLDQNNRIINNLMHGF
jgi:hypothetical protein